MAAVCRAVAGIPVPLKTEVEQCLDVPPVGVAESRLQEALRILDAALPGSGSVRERYGAWQTRLSARPTTGAELRAVVERTLGELRRRTQSLVTLPPEEGVAFHPVSEKPWGAANWYQGRYRSRLELSIDKPLNLLGLPYLLAHEAYPGHHTESACKERQLVHEKGLEEQALVILGPQLVIAEGIASTALDMVFEPQELAVWVNEELLEPLGR